MGAVRAWASVGVDPEIMGFGPAPAIRKVLERSGLQLSDIDLFEINEAFAGQYLAVEKDLGLDRDPSAPRRVLLHRHGVAPFVLCQEGSSPRSSFCCGRGWDTTTRRWERPPGACASW